jgi:hypothetical protein
MYRALSKILVGMAVALGLTLTAAPVASAAPQAPAQAPAQRAEAPACTTEGQNLTKAYNNYQAANAYAGAADAKVKKLKKKLKKAKKHDAPAKKVKKLKKKAKKAKKAKSSGIAVRNAYVSQYNAAYGAYYACKNPGVTPPPAPSSPQLPIQALCDAVPQLQPLCDTIVSVVDPLMTTFDQICAQFPVQAKGLCDALKAGFTNPAGLVDVLKSTLTNLGLGALVTTLDPVWGLLDTLLGALAGGLPSLPSGGGNPLCAILPLPLVC